MTNIIDVTRQVQKYMKTLKAIKDAPSEPPSKVSDFPFAITYPQSGDIEWGPGYGGKLGLHDLVVEVHVGLKDLPDAVATAIPFIDSVPNLLMSKLMTDNKWNGHIDTFQGISYTFGPLGYGGLETIGPKFIIRQVKILGSVE
jgi:hypothetical protein